MTTVIVSVERARLNMECRRCSLPICVGQRAVLVLGVGTVHVRCVLDRRTLVGADDNMRAADENAHQSAPAARPAEPEPGAP